MQPVDLREIVREMNEKGLRQWLLIELEKSFRDAKKGKLGTTDENSFEVCWMANLVHLCDTILDRTYQPGEGIAFVIFDPMVREIFAAPFRDRVVHHFLYNMCMGWWDRRLIHNTFSCRVGKGTLAANKTAQRHMLKATRNCTRHAIVVKCDIKGYFMSLPREKLVKRVIWGLERQFKDVMDEPMGRKLFEICKFLWEMILLDDPIEKAVKRGPLSNWDPKVLPPSKSLYCQPFGYGIVIGNVTSQMVSNIYLDLLDRFITIELGYKCYGRYVDDFYIMVPSSEWPRLREDLKRIREFLSEELELTLHPKKMYVQDVYKGFTFAGARVTPHCRMPSNRVQRHFEAALKRLAQGEGNIEGVISYIGLMRHMDSWKYVTKQLEKYQLV